MRRFNHWAYLNEEGMEIFGEAFPDKTVPVLSMIPRRGPLGEPDSPPQDYYLVKWDELEKEAQETVLEVILEKQGGTHAELLAQIAEDGLPLRQSLTNGAGTDNPVFFI